MSQPTDMVHPHPAMHDKAVSIVRDGLCDVRIALGETSHEAEAYEPRHAKPDPWEWKPGFGWVARDDARWSATPVTPHQELTR